MKTLRSESTGDEWYISTEGSNLATLYMEPGLALQRDRCLTTSIPEMLAAFGLEAVCWIFSNGSLAESLGVNNASCRLLVDHMASRGI